MLKTYEKFTATVENFEQMINDLLTSADAAEITVKELQGQKVSALMVGDVAGAVLLSKQISDEQETIAHNRESAALMESGKWKAFVNTIEDVTNERNQVVADMLKKFEAKAVIVAKAKESYLKELSELGAIHQIAKDAHHDLADAQNVVNTFEGNPKGYRHYGTDLNWDAQPLYRPSRRDNSTPVGVLALTMPQQKLAYDPKDPFTEYFPE
ncbi:hypothetical protein [Desulfosporosinus sp. BG]|uniref:hypothetical protein n=1 Tax=Desulfosporosinus sp. BG TaxID=1633135 RepID=UPI00083A808B|nr:hypothetical protein [Desulfosporosinus sp. BG]ODA41240.1 hypothetical protein DSBG_2011 [Desulfosporosinus sp. BG]